MASRTILFNVEVTLQEKLLLTIEKNNNLFIELYPFAKEANAANGTPREFSDWHLIYESIE